MAIRKASPNRGRHSPAIIRTTLSLPNDLIERIDSEVRDGVAEYPSRNEFIRHACEMRLWQLREEEIDRQILAAAGDPEWAAEEEQIMKEFEAADAETARAITEEFGPYPIDDDQL